MRGLLFGTACCALLARAVALGSAARAGDPEPPNPAADWRPLGKVSGISLSWNAAAVEHGATLVVPVRSTPPTPGNTAYSHAVTRMEMRCAPAEAHAIQTINYRPDGTIGRIDNNPVPFAPIPPGSMMARLHDALCPAPAPAARPGH